MVSGPDLLKIKREKAAETVATTSTAEAADQDAETSNRISNSRNPTQISAITTKTGGSNMVTSVIIKMIGTTVATTEMAEATWTITMNRSSQATTTPSGMVIGMRDRTVAMIVISVEGRAIRDVRIARMRRS